MSFSKSKSDKYKEASKKFEEAYNKYAGEAGLAADPPLAGRGLHLQGIFRAAGTAVRHFG